MNTFAKDIDLLHWEPTIFKDAAFVSQTLVSGTGSLSGTQFTLASSLLGGVEIIDAEVIYLGGSIDGCFPIVSIDSGTELTLSILYDKLTGDPPTPARIGPDPSDIPFVIRTFWAQRSIVTQLLLQFLGLTPEQFDAVLNPEALRRACTLGALQMIYSAMSAAAPDAAGLSVRADLYERLYRRAIRVARVELDLNGDGEADARRTLNTLALVRD